MRLSHFPCSKKFLTAFLWFYGLRVEITCLIALLFLHGTYAFFAMPVQDDWWIISVAAEHDTLIDLAQYWFSVIGHRPTYAFLLSVLGWGLQNHVWAYAVLTSTVWCCAVLLAARSLRPFLCLMERRLFIFLGCVPLIASATIFASVQMVASTFATLLWAISLFFQQRAIHGKNLWNYAFSFACVCLALLSYEAVLPLIFFSALLTLFTTLNSKNSSRSFAIKNLSALIKISPQWAAMVTVLLYKITMKFVYPSFLLKVESRSWTEHFFSLGDWAAALLLGFPLLVFSTLTNALTLQTLLSPLSFLTVCFAAVFSYLAVTACKSPDAISRDRRRVLMLATIIALFSGSLVFFLSGYSARVEGLGTRLWASTWILLCVMASVFFTRLSQRLLGVFFVVASISVVTLSYCVQMRAYIRSTLLADNIAVSLYQTVQTQDYHQGDPIICVVPRYWPDNLNNEPVLEDVYLEHMLSAKYPSQKWCAFAVFPPFKWVNDSSRIPKGYFDASYIEWSENTLTLYRPVGMTWKHPDVTSVWLYVFDFATASGDLRLICSPAELERQLASFEATSTYGYKKPLSESVRDKIKAFVAQRFFLDRTIHNEKPSSHGIKHNE
jgi:hypothetical protein